MYVLFTRERGERHVTVPRHGPLKIGILKWHLEQGGSQCRNEQGRGAESPVPVTLQLHE